MGFAARRRDQELLLQALRSIPVDLQIALELHYWEGMRGPELAAVLDIPEGTVRSRLRRGKQLLGEKMVEIGASEEQLETTMTNLDGWARALRDWLAAPDGGT